MNIAAYDVGVVHREKAMLLIKTRSFRQAVGKERCDLAPIVFAGDAAGAVERVGSEHPGTGDMGDVQFVLLERRCQALVFVDPVEGYPWRRLKTRGAAVTHLFAPLHVPVNFVLRHAEVVFQDAANPQRRGLLIFRYA